ncbi:MAG TPA: ElyC/SanA/YdcF family protein [Solirubrobacteraceae bacterium]|nr:ElyC/SanA/YdcF family protein [Solirubrobacteraceae bacterium]
MRRVVVLLCALAAAGVAALAAANALVLLGGRGAPPREADAALVLGARVHPDGRPTAMLDDRIRAAVALHRAGRVRKLLLSGDHGTRGYDEVNAMRRRALELGVPARDVFTDHAGFDTWDSSVRARRVFGARSVVVVTQAFHVPRAVWLARRAGLRAGGVAADRPGGYGRWGRTASMREVLARVKGARDGLFEPSPRFLGPAIPIAGDGRASWD